MTKKTKAICCIVVILALFILAGAVTGCSKKGENNSDSKQSDFQSTASSEDSNQPKNGFYEEDGVRYYYIDNVLQVNTIIGNDTDGYFYAADNGAIDMGYCDGVTVDDKDWIVIEGAAYPVETESDKCLFAAAKDIAACTQTNMSKEEKLQASFDYIREHYLEGVLHNPPYSYTVIDWPIVVANDLFVYGKGDCYSYGAAFAYYARAIGYTEVYACNSGGHGWTEIDSLVYDAEWSKHSDNYSYYAMSYDEECDVPYASAIEDQADYKRLKIDIHSDYKAS